MGFSITHFRSWTGFSHNPKLTGAIGKVPINTRILLGRIFISFVKTNIPISLTYTSSLPHLPKTVAKIVPRESACFSIIFF